MVHRRANSRSYLEAALPPAVPATPIRNLTSLPPFLLNHRKSRSPTFLALFSLIFTAAYLFFISHPKFDLSSVSFRVTNTSRLHRVSGESATLLPFSILEQKKKSKGSGHKHKHGGGRVIEKAGPELLLDRDQELAAISSFLASLPQNAIPHTVDPSRPIDPHLVLDFDTRGPNAPAEVKAMMEDVWARNPVMLYCKLRSPVSREIKAILAGLKLTPPPTIFDVDQRPDSAVLTPMLTRLTSSPNLPILLVGGKPVGPISAIRDLQETGALKEMIKAAGAAVDTPKKKKGRR